MIYDITYHHMNTNNNFDDFNSIFFQIKYQIKMISNETLNKNVRCTLFVF